MGNILKSIIFNIFFVIFFITLFPSQKSFSMSFIHTNHTDSNITLPGFIECFIDYKTSNCDDCPPSCLSFNSSNIIVNNKILAKNIDKVFENELRQISDVRSGANKNDSYTAIIYLYSLLIKNQINVKELKLIEEIVNETQTTGSLISLGKNVKEKLNILDFDSNSNVNAIAIVNIISKAIDLLIDGDHMIYTIESNPNLLHDLDTQKKWLMEVLENTIIGCDALGISGCLAASVASTGIS